jgi:hypothetical protein
MATYHPSPGQIDALKHYLLGTQHEEYDALIALGFDELDDGDVVEAMGYENIDRCEECDTWVETSELVDDDGDVTSCTGCGSHKIAG